MGIAIMPAGMWVQLWFPCSWEFENYYNNNFLIVLWWSQRIHWFPLYEPDLCPLLKRSKYICKIWGSHNCDYEYSHVLGCYVEMYWQCANTCCLFILLWRWDVGGSSQKSVSLYHNTWCHIWDNYYLLSVQFVIKVTLTDKFGWK
jgi:hypothetical protein